MNKKQKIKKIRIPINQCHLYGIRSPHALANRLGWKLSKLENLANNGHYKVYKHKITGREIQEPCSDLQSLHRQFHRYFSRIEVPHYLHSAVKGRSYLTNARTHIGNHPIFKIDIKKFYQSTPQHKVMHFFRDVMNCAPDVAGLLANLICHRKILATGSSVSPIISYYAYKSLFDNLSEFAVEHDLIMTCYVDDITMSGPRASRFLLHEVREIIFKSGLRAHKDRFFAKNSVKIVTGVAIKQDKIDLPFSRWRKIRKLKQEIEKCTDNKNKLKLLSKIISCFHEAAQIDPQFRLRAEFYQGQRKKLKDQMSGNC